MEDLVKYAIAAGISIPVANLLYKKYKKKKILNKFNINKNSNGLPHDVFADLVKDAAELQFSRR